MILNGSGGKGYGKSGSKVYSINHGVMIEREYNSRVSNPSTSGQVTQRSRFKLASQVSAAMAPVIVIPRKGIQSPRNLFVKKNMGYFYGSVEGASVSYESLQITPGCVGFPAVSISRENPNHLNLALASSVVNAFDQVVYNVFQKDQDNQLILVDSAVVDITSSAPTGAVSLDPNDGDLFVYAYGLRIKNPAARALYGNLQVESGLDIARLVANRTLELNNFQFSITRCSSIGAGEQENELPDEDQVIIYAKGATGGSVTAEGLTNGQIIVDKGDHVTLTAVPDSGWIFYGWHNNGQQGFFSTTSPLTIVANENRDIVASFMYTGGGLE